MRNPDLCIIFRTFPDSLFPLYSYFCSVPIWGPMINFRYSIILVSHKVGAESCYNLQWGRVSLFVLSLFFYFSSFFLNLLGNIFQKFRGIHTTAEYFHSLQWWVVIFYEKQYTFLSKESFLFIYLFIYLSPYIARSLSARSQIAILLRHAHGGYR